MTTQTNSNQHAIDNAKGHLDDIKRLIAIIQTRDPADLGLDWERDLEGKQEQARRELLETPLCVEVNNGWHEVGVLSAKPIEYQITLTTGGPALRVIGDLNHGLPINAKMQWQDWGTPWTDYAEADEETLLAFAQQFYFGD